MLDLSRVLAGPYCTTLLWELGAEVVKIEQPGHGDDTRAFPPFQKGESVYFASINRGKRSLALDLKNADDRAVFEGLLARADVLVENFRPGTMERLGYGYAALKDRFPGLIFAAISGFGDTGPYRDLPAYDLIVQALGGMISINGEEGGNGVRLGVSLADLAAGVFAALAIASALYERRTSGQGRFIDVAMLDVQTMLLESALVRQFATGANANTHGLAPSGYHAVRRVQGPGRADRHRLRERSFVWAIVRRDRESRSQERSSLRFHCSRASPITTRSRSSSNPHWRRGRLRRMGGAVARSGRAGGARAYDGRRGG